MSGGGAGLAGTLPGPAACRFWRSLPLVCADRPSIILLRATAAAQNSLMRMLRRLAAPTYGIVEPEIGLLHHGRDAAAMHDELQLHPFGYIHVWWYRAPMLAQLIQSQGRSPEQFRCVATMRDPRDSLCSLYHLMFDPRHTPGPELAAYHAAYRVEQQRVAGMSIDEYMHYKAADWVDWCSAAYAVADSHPTGVEVLSYAELCLDFPRFLDRLVKVLRVGLSPALRADLLATEDVRRPQRLAANSYARSATASPLPGRHRRELKPATVEWLNDQTRSLRAWMAARDPLHAETYAD